MVALCEEFYQYEDALLTVPSVTLLPTWITNYNQPLAARNMAHFIIIYQYRTRY